MAGSARYGLERPQTFFTSPIANAVGVLVLIFSGAAGDRGDVGKEAPDIDLGACRVDLPALMHAKTGDDRCTNNTCTSEYFNLWGLPTERGLPAHQTPGALYTDGRDWPPLEATEDFDELMRLSEARYRAAVSERISEDGTVILFDDRRSGDVITNEAWMFNCYGGSDRIFRELITAIRSLLSTGETRRKIVVITDEHMPFSQLKALRTSGCCQLRIVEKESFGLHTRSAGCRVFNRCAEVNVHGMCTEWFQVTWNLPTWKV